MRLVWSLALLVPALAQDAAAIAMKWAKLLQNIEVSSLLNTAPGTTLERDIRALIFFFNNTCREPVADKTDAFNPYRGAFARTSDWRQQRGWDSIVQAHSEVEVQCRALYMEGAEEFVGKHCFWNIQADPVYNATASPVNYVMPQPPWSIVEDCCEQLQRPVLRVYDAVWATTRGVGRAFRNPSPTGGQPGWADADDTQYVPKLNCDDPINMFSFDCEGHIRMTTPANTLCQGKDNCPRASKPIGLRSKHYFNVGIAVGEKGTIIRTMDGGYSWDCIFGCARGGAAEPDLLSVSTNVRMGGFGYSQVYYDVQAGPVRDGVPWPLLDLEGITMGQGLDGVWWPEETFLEGFAVGKAGSIVKIEDAGVTGWDPDDPESITGDPRRLQRVNPVNLDGSGCNTFRDINDVFFWNQHLAFFVGDAGFICRYGIAIQEGASANGPGINVDEVTVGTIDVRWDMQGADDLALNWGYIIDNKDYMYSNLKSVFCLQVSDMKKTVWQSPVMDPAEAITYSQHLTCFAVGSHPGTAGTSSAILRYQSSAVLMGIDPLDGVTPIYSEEVSWKPQNSQTSTTINDIYCIKSADGGATEGTFDSDGLSIYCYAVGDGGLIRKTSNGGLSPWRSVFCGVTENLRKVVIVGVTHSEQGFGPGGANGGEYVVVVGDNGRVLYSNDGGNVWQKLERVTPEHLVSIQFNAFDDFYYADGGDDLTTEANLFEAPDAGQALPFGNGIATGSIMYDWMSKKGDCGIASPNTGTGAQRVYDCRKPEISTVLRTNCGGTPLSHWRCRSECAGQKQSVTVELVDTLASDALWNGHFGSSEIMVNGFPTEVPNVNREPGKGIWYNVPACDEVWTIGHGRPWHEDTRETRAFQSAPIDEQTGLPERYDDKKSIRPVHDMCLYGWPRHDYRLHETRESYRTKCEGPDCVSNYTWVVPTVPEYTFLNRLRISKDNCTLLGGAYYQAEDTFDLKEDCVFEFGTLTTCPSWEVHGMAHSEDPFADPVATEIPYVNYSVITDPCNDEWYGVTCEAHETDDAFHDAVPNRSVTQMWLYSNNLQGELPHLLSDLNDLQSFSLGSNRLGGSIPNHIWKNMSSLKYLSLAENKLVGAIPSEFGELGTLEELRLHANSLDGAVPSQLGTLASLQTLSFHANSLDGELPSELGDLGALQYLWTSSNNFTGALPSQLGKLSNLRYLWFANNSVSSIPKQIGDLAALRSLDGSRNAIADRLPYTIGRLGNLRVLKLGHNLLRATIPDALGLCTSLVVLELQRNKLVGPVPASFGALEVLTTLDLSHNLLERTLPDSIEGMKRLQVLLLNDNNFEGGLPPLIGTLRDLEVINMARNALTDPLPDELVNCDRLEELSLQGNRITGALPSGIWRLQMLEYLVMDNNQLVGPLPEGIGYLSQIRELRLNDNKIDGTMPDTIGDAVSLEIFRLDNNALTGTIPSTVGKLRNVLTFDMQRNAFSGAIPAEISGLHSALLIYLQQNKLSGQIPHSLGDLVGLHELRASYNQLTGEVPPSMGKLLTLVQLALDNNFISGAIPNELGLLSEKLKVLHLHNNQLNGLVPSFLKMDEFRTVDIDLAGNPFWCPLPAWPTIHTASCVHCPKDVYVSDKHRTCSDHGVCIDGMSCRCDPEWTGDQCDLLDCPKDCTGHGTCFNEVVPETCALGNTTNPAEGLCMSIEDTCVAAYHDCPHKGVSSQVDSSGIVIAEAAKHNNIINARCLCEGAWSGNDCSLPPPSPPKMQPWPDLIAENAAGRRAGGAARSSLVATLCAAVAAVALARR